MVSYTISTCFLAGITSFHYRNDFGRIHNIGYRTNFKAVKGPFFNVYPKDACRWEVYPCSKKCDFPDKNLYLDRDLNHGFPDH